MTFPTINGTPSTGSTGGGSNVTSHDLVAPAGVQAGELLLAKFGCDGGRSGDGGSNSMTWPAGWTRFVLGAQGAGTSGVGVSWAWRIADGTESGATVTVTTGTASERGYYWIARIGNWHGTTPPEAAAVVGGTGAAADPGALVPSWGAADTLWLAGVALDGNSTASAAPANYTDLFSAAEGTAGGAGIGVARRQLNAASDDPGTFTNTSADWVATLIAIRPAGGGGGPAPVTRSFAAILG